MPLSQNAHSRYSHGVLAATELFHARYWREDNGIAITADCDPSQAAHVQRISLLAPYRLFAVRG